MSSLALHPAVPRLSVSGAGTVVDHDGEAVPCLVLAAERGAGRLGGLFELPRAVERHGAGDLRSELTVLQDRVLLMVSSTTPVRSRFVVEVPIPAMRSVVDAGADAGRIVLAPTSVDGGPDDADVGWLAVDLDGTTIRQALHGG